MGKRKGKSTGENVNKNNHRNNKRQKKNHNKKGGRRFWIEQCKDRKVPKTIPSNLVFPLLISRVELTDDHKHGGKCNNADAIVKNEAEDVKKCSGNDSKSTPCEASDQDCKLNENAQNQITEETENSAEGNNETAASAVLVEGVGASTSSPLDIEKKEVGVTDDAKREPFIQVIRAQSAKGKPSATDYGRVKVKDLPNGDCGDGIINPFPKDEVADKYWAQRKRLFSKFDEGIKLDKESWYSVTPEAIAGHIAKRISTMTPNVKDNVESDGIVVLDAFCGVGGNGIGFALQEGISFVICVDIDREKLRMAANNASIYNVDPAKIVFVEGNAVDVLGFYKNGMMLKKLNTVDTLSENEESDDQQQEEICNGYTVSGYKALPDNIDSVFLSPPWGGMDYLQAGNSGYELSKCIQVTGANANPTSDESEAGCCNGVDLLSLSSVAGRNKNVVYFLPKNINGYDIGKAAWDMDYRNGNGIELEQNLLNGKLKTVTVYLSES